MTIEILTADESHIDSAWSIVARCRDALRAEGIVQWDDVYPTRAVVAADAARGQLFVAVENGDCVATAAVDEVQAVEYRTISWTTREPALVVHRLCVDPVMQGRGVGRLMTAFIREYAERERFASIRLDAYSGNPPAVAMYRRMGFREAGQVSFPRRELPFVLFEQEVSSSGG